MLTETVYKPACSIGLVCYPSDAQTVKELLINADIALYEAKKSARNQWLFFDASIKEKLNYKKYINNLLITAIEQDLFTIVMQPICNVKTREHVGFEVLLRLSDNDTPISPDVFIPIAEAHGLMTPIGDIVLHKAMSAFRNMLDKGLSPGKVAINFAPPQFLECDLVERIQELMAHFKLPPELLVIEITETAFIGSTAKTVASVLTKLQALGIEVALDDFGTGFSSLSHLRDFNVNKIKIDKSFISDIAEDPSDLALVQGLVRLAQKMQLDVVAEGVETETQLQLLRNCRCEYMQGYYHSRPLTPENAIAFLQSNHQ
jgi:EAL domain-containing protein (putative c-di-GMP-specific phosphodiesterase class I)